MVDQIVDSAWLRMVVVVVAAMGLHRIAVEGYHIAVAAHHTEHFRKLAAASVVSVHHTDYHTIHFGFAKQPAHQVQASS